MTREQYMTWLDEPEVDTQDTVDTLIDLCDTLYRDMEIIESKLTISREFIQSVRNYAAESVEWKELDETLEAIK